MTAPTNPTGAITRDWVLVPREPTPEMHEAGHAAGIGGDGPMGPDFVEVNADIWRAMISAVPLGDGGGIGATKIPEKYRAKIAEMLSWSHEDWLLLKAYFHDEIEHFRKVIMGAPPSGSGSHPSDQAASHPDPSGEYFSRGWQPIETAPKDGTRFWAFQLTRDEPEQQYVCWWQEDFANWTGWQDNWDTDPFPTHWMPLPAPPVALAGEARQGQDAKRLDPKDDHAATQVATPKATPTPPSLSNHSNDITGAGHD